MPSNMMFSFTLIMSSLITIMSNQWITIWIGFEMNLLSIVPLLINSYNMNESESTIKYFLIQAVGGGLILISSLSYFYAPSTLFSMNITMLLLTSGLMVKLGAAPLHYWFPQVMSGISWPMCIILSTWQKIPPFLILIYLIHFNSPNGIMLLGLISVAVGGIMGLNQTQLRPLLAYSSIAHLGWMLIASTLSSFISILYLSIYIIISLSIMFLAMSTNTSSTSLAPRLKAFPSNNKLFLIVLLLSFGGIPPLLGFLPKLMVSYKLVLSSFIPIAAIILMLSLISLFYYLSLLFNSSMNKPSLLNMDITPTKWAPTLLMFIGTFPLPILTSFIL